MIASRILRILSLLGCVAITASANATSIFGCKTATKSNVECSSILGATNERGGISASTSHYVGYRGGLNQSSVFMGGALTVTNYDVFATSEVDLAAADQGSGSTMVVAFDAETMLSGLVLSGLGDIADSPLQSALGGPLKTEVTQVVAYNAVGGKVSDQLVESQSEYAYVDFGGIVSQISTLFISSGGGLPGLTASNNGVAYFITPVPEPASVLLILTGLGFLGLCRRNG